MSNLCQTSCACALKICDFEVNQTKIKGGCQSGRKLAPHDSKSDLPLVYTLEDKAYARKLGLDPFYKRSLAQ